MKFSQYFLFARERPDRRGIKMEWIELAVRYPIREEIQEDGRIRRWARIKEANGKYLRVILLPDRETVHNAFFDSSFVR
ncbi:MAG: DUF4258 domain-containing protein [Candidatus Sumerlaeota bacterium]|nr:DUF4258 domain-containing protein [Candidatus Sumerlaeota bacterium]